VIQQNRAGPDGHPHDRSHRRDLAGATSRRLAVTMPDQECWISLADAVERIRTGFKCAVGAAQNALISASEAGDVRSRHGAHFEKQCPPLSKSDWIGADIELANDRIVKALGNDPVVKAERVGMKGVEFSEGDLAAWIAGEAAARPAGPRARRLTSQSVRGFVTELLTIDPDGTMDKAREAARGAGYVGGRDLIDPEYRRQKSAGGEPVRRGRRRRNKSESIIRGN
jgi:hypothetical protein